MTEYELTTAGSRFRAVAAGTDYNAAPPEAQDLNRANTIHWWSPSWPNGSATDGARWGLSWGLDRIFGPIIGALLEEMSLSNVERWDGARWVPLA